MKVFIGTENSSGRQIIVCAPTEEKAYEKIGRDIYKMSNPIDTGNVDVDLKEIKQDVAEYIGD